MATDMPQKNEVKPKTLVIVCCHAIYLPKADPTKPEQVQEEANWLLADFQRSADGKEGEHQTFIEHITRGHALAYALSRNVNLILSGGATKTETEKSEGQSYLDALLTMSGTHSAPNWFAEERATDSFQNILFSLLKHYQIEGSWPKFIRIVTHAFKAERMKLHLRALRWPENKAQVEGIDPPFGEDERRAVEGFEERCLEEWKADLYGCRPPLSDKRMKRRWSPSTEMFENLSSDTAIRQLLEWDGGDDSSSVFPHQLPWE